MHTIKKVSILGSTGSIGVSTLDVCRQHPDLFQIVGLAAGTNVELLIKQIKEFSPQIVSVASQKEYDAIKPHLSSRTTLMMGVEGAEAVATHSDVHTVVSAIVGAAGLIPTFKAIQAKKTIALANKESLVIAGELMSAAARENGVQILPVDSEHSALFQCLRGEHVNDISRLILTASGGPFLTFSIDALSRVTKTEALKHPNWTMGAKVTIDSATMMNKGLEMMEAHWLFDVPVAKINVVVHPQSVVHSMVEFVDGSVLAQMGEPDMRVPIAYALSWPRRVTTSVKKLSLPEREKLTFFEPDLQKFRCLKIAYDVAQAGRSFPAVLNAANEVLVRQFLDDKISFIQIASLLEDCLQAHVPHNVHSLEDVVRADEWGRGFIKGKSL